MKLTADALCRVATGAVMFETGMTLITERDAHNRGVMLKAGV